MIARPFHHTRVGCLGSEGTGQATGRPPSVRLQKVEGGANSWVFHLVEPRPISSSWKVLDEVWEVRRSEPTSLEQREGLEEFGQVDV